MAHYNIVTKHIYALLFIAISFFILTVIGCSLPNVNGSGFSAQDHYEFGVHWLEARDFPRAEFSFRKAIELDEHFGDAYIQLGLVYYILYEKEVSLNKNPETILRYYNFSYNCFQEGLKYSPQNPQSYMGIARLQIVAGQFDKSIVNLLKAREVTRPDDIATEIIIHNELGNCYLGQEKYQEALAEYTEYLKLVPTGQEHDNIKCVVKEIQKQLETNPLK